MTRYERVKQMYPEELAKHVDELIGLGGPYTCNICKYSGAKDERCNPSSETCKQGFIEYLKEEI